MNKNPGFQEIRPDLMDEWNFEKNGGIDPQNISANSKRKIWWKCSQGHEWLVTVASRVMGMGCPFCSGKFLMKHNDLSAAPADLCSERKQEGVSSHELMAHPVGFAQNVWWKDADGRVIRMPSDSSMRNPSDEVQSNA